MMTSETPAPLLPKLRFPEFEDAPGWEEKQLQSVSNPVKDKIDNNDVNPILTLSGEHGIVLQSDYFGKQIAGKDLGRYIKIARDDFVYNDRVTQRSSYGTIKRLSAYDGGIVSPIYKCFRFNNDQNPVFWQWYFESGSHDKALGGLVNEGARAGRFNISVDRFLSTSIWHPSGSEQKKIADCLGSLDDLIAAECRKLEALRQHKQGLMQQLFPQPGETVPRLRFPEFEDAGEWEATTVGEQCQSFSGGTPDTSKKTLYYGGSIPFIRSAEIAADETELTLTEEGFSNSAAKMVSRGDVLIALYGANSGDTGIARIDGAINQAIMCLRPTICAPFLYHYLTARKRWTINTYLQGGQGNLSGQIVLSVPIAISDEAEQERIAECLSDLDEYLEIQQRRLDSLRQHKQGLLQQLFPSLEGAV